MNSPSGEGESQNDLAIVDLPGGLEAELLVERPRFTVARLVAGQQLGRAVR
jgi:hypothetical protein